jgi:hypothetical protein
MAPVTRGPRAVTPLLRGLVWVLAGAMLSCGNSLVDDTYSGTPLFTVKGSVIGPSEAVDAANAGVRIALFWTLGGMGTGSGEGQVVEQPGTARSAEYFRSFDMNLFDEPDARHLTTLSSGARFGVAWLAAYRDENGNGRKDETEPFTGSSVERVLIRALDALPARESPTGAALPAGWHLVSAPLNCPQTGGSSTDPVADGECGVPLGADCKDDAACGAGVCVKDFIGQWPSGACLIPEPPRNGCRQRGSALLRDVFDPTKAYWLKSCVTSADCGRPAPYQCDQQLRVCRPSAQMPVELNDRGPPRSYCRMQETTPQP